MYHGGQARAVRRERDIHFRASQTEEDLIKRAAALERRNTAEWLRLVALDAAERVVNDTVKKVETT